ncbi:MAG: APC family permease [Gammaproteobacteria bacterium]|nr:APC family permease [Gammaproteobacteria bacterium]
MEPDPDSRPKLKRALTLPMLTLYGLGTTIGAGIYALLGEIAGVAGYGAPFSFLVASLVAGFTACSFAELAARYPRAAGAALYVQRGFDVDKLSTLVGLLVVASGLVSAAALVNGFNGYLQAFFALDRGLVIVVVCLLLGALAAWGIVESVAVAALITLVEIGGLAIIIAVGADKFTLLGDRWVDFVPGMDSAGWAGVMIGVTLAFYAFIGFEDMVDIAEEVKDVRRNMPRGILLTLGISSLLYFVLMVTALLSLSPAELSASAAPMATLFEANTGSKPVVIGFIAMFAIINGALIQLVMVSRVLYGLSSRGQLPSWFARVNAATRTPLIATIVGTLALILLALAGRLAGLAATTSMIMLTIFTFVNLALWRIKGRESEPPDILAFPRFVPIAGAVLSAGFVIREVVASLPY